MKAPETQCAGVDTPVRIDRLLCYLRFVKTRSRAQELVAAGQIRRNGQRVTRTSQPIGIGDTITLPLGRAIKVVTIERIPARRGPPCEAQACYRDLDPHEKSGIAHPEL
ncbi:RNA-binding S4 domain-containing protein [Alteripontixanthobacter muriae]|uniref:RNA-binding S4 domain-containing protein n=1 Tax=Alteripontixanthobacter muriae TaxID=2705546 RepID=UPI002FC3A473